MPGLPEKASSHNKKRAFMIEVKSKKSWRPFAGAAIIISVAAIAGQSVLASLNATAFNTTAQKVTSGTMSLKFDNTTSRTTFTSDIANLVPGDVVYRYVTLTNDGSISGQNLKLSLATAPGNTPTLINDLGTAKALRLTVKSCLAPWTVTSGNSTCSSGEANEVSENVIGSLVTTPELVGSGNLAAGDIKYLQLKLELPNQDETTVNGIPNVTNTIQGGTVNLTYTFDLAQRTAVTTNS